MSLSTIKAAITEAPAPTSRARVVGRVALGSVLLFAGISHLTLARKEFSAQVPNWFPVGSDLTVLASGAVEITLGGALVAWSRRRVAVGLIAAAFFVVIFPGNIAQWTEGKDGFGLDTDAKRFVRLFFQPVLVAMALGSTGALKELRRHALSPERHR